MKEIKKFPLKKWLSVGVLSIIVFGSIFVFLQTLEKNWDVINFAIDKPEIVRAVKINYEGKVKAVEEQLIKTEKTPEDKLIETVLDQLDPKK